MLMLENIFLQFSVVLGITASIAFFMRLLRQPLLTGYIVAGIVTGPFFLNLLHGGESIFDALAEFGVVLLLFMVGLSLNLDHLKRIGKVSLLAGVGQVIFTATVGFFILQGLGFSLVSSFYLATSITFSSTIIIVKLLQDKGDTNATYGRYVLGLMIVQDIIAVFVMLVITSIGGDNTLLQTAGELALKGLLLLALAYFLSVYFLPKALKSIAHSSELLFIFTIAWCFGVSSILYIAGFGLEIGAIIAGISLGSSPYSSQIGSRIKPLRDFFIILFFIILGSELSISGIGDVWLPAIILSFFILIGNPLILYLIFRSQKFTRRNSFLAGLTAAQVSEFGFILLYTGVRAGHVNGPELPIFTITALVTIFFSAYLITYAEKIYRLLIPFFELFGKDKFRQRENKEQSYDVIVFGYHRIGWKVCEALLEKKVSFVVIDFDPIAISKLKHRGIHAIFGDAADVEFLETLPIGNAKLVISTLPEADDQLVLIHYIREVSKDTKIICNLYHSTHLHEFYQAGADYVMMPHLLGGNWIADIIKNKPWTETTFAHLKEDQKEDMKLRFSKGVS